MQLPAAAKALDQVSGGGGSGRAVLQHKWQQPRLLIVAKADLDDHSSVSSVVVDSRPLSQYPLLLVLVLSAGTISSLALSLALAPALAPFIVLG